MTRISAIKAQISEIINFPVDAQEVKCFIPTLKEDARTIIFWEKALEYFQNNFAPQQETLPDNWEETEIMDRQPIAVHNSYPVIDMIINQNNTNIEDAEMIDLIKEDCVVVLSGKAWRVIKKIDAEIALIKDLYSDLKRYAKISDMRFSHCNYQQYLQELNIKIDSVVAIGQTLYRVVGRDGDKLFLENGGGEKKIGYIGEVSFVHSNYKEYTLTPSISDAIREYEKRLNHQAAVVCYYGSALQKAIEEFNLMRHDVPKSANISVLWLNLDGSHCEESLVEAIQQFEITLEESNCLEQ